MTLELDDPQASAEEAGLRYVSDSGPGVRRRRAGKGWAYIGTDGVPGLRKMTAATTSSVSSGDITAQARDEVMPRSA